MFEKDLRISYLLDFYGDVLTERKKEVLDMYANSNSEKHQQMVKLICEKMNFTTLRYYRLEDLIKAIGLDESRLCTYCFNGRE